MNLEYRSVLLFCTAAELLGNPDLHFHCNRERSECSAQIPLQQELALSANSAQSSAKIALQQELA